MISHALKHRYLFVVTATVVALGSGGPASRALVARSAGAQPTAEAQHVAHSVSALASSPFPACTLRADLGAPAEPDCKHVGSASARFAASRSPWPVAPAALRAARDGRPLRCTLHSLCALLTI